LRALETIQQRIRIHAGEVHAARWKALWITVAGLIGGGQLWLTALGRARPGRALCKHQIKAVDRLLGNRKLFGEIEQVYAAVAKVLLKGLHHPVLLVDTVEVQTGRFALIAALAFDGRAISIYVNFAKNSRATPRECERFLDGLARVLPPGCRPILITDAGFEGGWFDAVAKRGWDYLSRVRNRNQFLFCGEWRTTWQIYELASQRPKNLGMREFPKKRPCARRLVLSKRPKTRHRRKLTRAGRRRRGTYERAHRKSHQEPLLLTTSLSCSARQVVNLFLLRMQIEESFRDTKNSRWGWALRHARTRDKRRLAVLLLTGALGHLVAQLVGSIAERLGLQRQYQANTHSKRRVLSFFFLGRQIVGSTSCRISLRQMRAGIPALRRKIRTFSLDATT